MPSLLNVAECQNEKFGVGDRVDADRMRRIADVEQQAEAGARAAGEADRRIDRDVVALIRAGRRTGGCRGPRPPARRRRLPRRASPRAAAAAAAASRVALRPMRVALGVARRHRQIR